MTLSKGYLGKVVGLLSPQEKRRLWLVIVVSIFVTLVEVVGIGSVMPFMTVASRPDMISENQYLRWAYEFLGFETPNAFLIFLGVGVLGMLILTNGSQALLHYAKVRFASMRRHALSLRLLRGYLSQGFAYFLNRNSYEFVKNINNEIGNMINTSLINLVEFLSRVIQVSLLALFLFLVNPTSTLIIVVVIGGLYTLVFTLVKKTLQRLGSERFALNTIRSRIVSEAFWGIKEVKISSSEPAILADYAPPSKKMARNQTLATIISEVPKFALETAAFSAIIGYVLFMILRSGGFQQVAGAVTLFVYAGYRMIPALQALFRAITQIRYGAPTAEKVVNEFETVREGAPLPRRSPTRLPFESALELKNVSFTYPAVDIPVISDLSLKIGAKSLIGLAGKTGCGKTTLVDIVLGLLTPQSGSIEVDGVTLSPDIIRNWQANLGYVPQNIYLSNDAVAANIAFGVAKKDIDMDAVVAAAKLSQIHDFVVQELKDGYETKIGERGIRLSGGQRQRVGIARALYRNPSVLIMDEATSALDTHTERAVMEAIDALQGTRTIILIAHRLSTLKKCDRIYLMENGRIIDRGTYSELRARNSYFAA